MHLALWAEKKRFSSGSSPFDKCFRSSSTKGLRCSLSTHVSTSTVLKSAQNYILNLFGDACRSLWLPAEPGLCRVHMQLAQFAVRKQNDGDAFPNSLPGSLCNSNCLARPAAPLLSVCLHSPAWINNIITVANPVSGKPPLLSWTCDCFCLPVFVHKYEAAACHL